MNSELWKDVIGYEKLYQVSNLGRVRSLDRIVYHYLSKEKTQLKKGQILKPVYNGKYCVVSLFKNGQKRQHRIHRLVAEAFLENNNNYEMINHKDENKKNNNVNNLEWCDAKYNCNYGSRKEKIANKKRKPILQYDLNGNLVREWISAREIEKETSISHQAIAKCCKGKMKKCYNYIWKYKEGK